MHWLYELPLWLLCCLVVASCVLFGLSGVRIVRQRGWMLDAENSAMAASAHAFIGVLYAVALGLMVVGVQGSFGDVERVVVQEADFAGDLYVDIEGFPDPERSDLQQLVRRYVRMVIDEEWPAVAQGGSSEETGAVLDSLVLRVVTYRPATDHAQLVFPEVLNGVDQLLDQRRERLFEGTQGTGAVTWAVVLFGAIITIGVAWFFHTPSARAHYLLVGTMSAMFGLMIFLIVAMDHPLWGRFSVQPDAFHRVLEGMDRWDKDRTTLAQLKHLDLAPPRD